MNRITNMLNDIPGTLMTLIVVVIALSVHEAAHAYAAYKMGDPTARSFGRLTINPLKHLDPLGFICMLLFGFGWAKPVPINTRYFKKPKLGMALSSLAGPLANFLMYLFGYFLFVLTSFLMIKGIFPIPGFHTGFGANLVLLLRDFLSIFSILNLSLAIFNLIPIPPLDGSRILLLILPPKYYFGLMKYERYIQITLLVLLWTGLLTGVLSSIVTAISNGIASIYVSFFNLFL